MPSVVPTILADNADDYMHRIDKVKPFAKRIHVDISDGIFTPTATVSLAQVYGIDGARLDLHLMLSQPETEYENVVATEPDLVICHFESQGDITALLQRFKEVRLKIGLAIKQETPIEMVKDLLPRLDHLLVFTGYLGFNGGDFDAEPLKKIAEAKAINPNLEVGVDGGLDQRSARLAVEAGADILNSGSFIQNAKDPEAAYIGLDAIARGEG